MFSFVLEMKYYCIIYIYIYIFIYRLEHLRAQDMPKSLPNRSEFFVHVHGDIVTIQQGGERAGKIQSEVLARAVCEMYSGAKAVSPALKAAVWKALRMKRNMADCS